MRDVDADVGNPHRAGVTPPGLEAQARLRRGEGDGRYRADRLAAHLARGPVDTRRDVDRKGPNALGVPGHPRRGAFQVAEEPGPVHRVDREVRATEGAIDGLRSGVVTELEEIDAHTPAAQDARGHQPVATVVALAADDHRTPAVRATEQPAHLPGDGLPGALHQHLDRRPGLDRAPVGLAHLLRRQDRLHVAASLLPSAMHDRHRRRLRMGQ